MPRRQFKPTPEQRKQVRTLAAVGTPQQDIARIIGIRSEKTLRRHFRDELDLSGIEATARVKMTLFEMATKEKKVEAIRLWMKIHRGFEHASDRPTPREAPPFLVMVEKEEVAEKHHIPEKKAA